MIQQYSFTSSQMSSALTLRHSLHFMLSVLLLFALANVLTVNAAPLTILTREISPEAVANKLLASFPEGLDHMEEQHLREARFFGQR
ncbi:hypothetical protein niasHT_010791 [Heterodera trifolii]|uniref:Uncharacterized protein n=1 Tax=Heterodera trifolii TaxID=157864 RepID=A0ABD2KV96_9BILA